MSKPGQQFNRFFCTLVFLLALATLVQRAAAHEIRPAIAQFDAGADGTFKVVVTLNLEAIVAGIGPQHKNTSQSPNAGKYNQLRSLEPGALKASFAPLQGDFAGSVLLKADGKTLALAVAQVKVPGVGDVDLARISKVVLTGRLPDGAKQITWTWPRKFGASVIRIRGVAKKAGEEPPVIFAAFLRDGRQSEPIALKGLLPQTGWQVFVNYLVTGYEHILPKGLDHILFVVGLFLLSARLSSLLWQISSFTLAHSLTLGLAMAGLISVSPKIVEPLIAASIVYVGIENAVTGKLMRWRPFIVFGFGLLHGLGFAGVLKEIGLQPGQFLTGLVAFNVGVEFGQLTVIAGCFLLVGLWFRHKPWYRARITTPASLVIAAIATWWFFERIFLA